MRVAELGSCGGWTLTVGLSRAISTHVAKYEAA
jgi:hypothetical protein